MITLAFDGWAECRLATDPDPSDEPRGVSGWTFAVAGEPDLDRVIRLRPEHAVGRKPGPTIGVLVREVIVDGVAVEAHPLAGATIDFLDDPVFEGRNGIAAEDALEPIFPFHLAIAGADGVALRREHRSLASSELVLEPPLGLVDVPDELTAVLGGLSPPAYRAARRSELAALLEQTTDDVAGAALRKRIADIDENVGGGIAFGVLAFALRYRIVMQGPHGEVDDPGHALAGTITFAPWIADFWFGAFDADSLCTFLRGRIELPFSPDP